MAIRHLTYRDIPASVRAQKAREVMQRVQTVLSDPMSTEGMRAAARGRQDQLRQWASGSLTETQQPLGESEPESAASEPEAHVSEAHTVEVTETVRVDDEQV
jgi:hypothetical protein